MRFYGHVGQQRLTICSHRYTETGYLPENFLPGFLDLVVWGHEHECLIDPRYNPEMNFHVMQPGSSVATSLMPGEAVPKHVALLSVTGRDFNVEPVRLKTVRPFAMKEIVLSEEKNIKHLARKENHRTELTRHLITIVDELIEQAKAEWKELQDDDDDTEEEAPKPLIRLRVEYSAPEGGNYDCENPQRFSNRFVEKVANVTDVIQFYRKKASSTRKTKGGADMPEESVLAQLAIDSVRIEKLVREFLEAQNLTILPQNSFGDAVSQFVDKDDRHAMEMFVQESLKSQIKHLMDVDKVDEEDLMDMVDQHRSKLEQLFAAGELKRVRKAKLRPKPDGWNSDLDGNWSDQPGVLVHTDNEAEMDGDEDAAASAVAPAKGRGKAAATKKAAAPAKKAPPAKGGRGKKKVVEEESEEEDEDNDILMVDSDHESQLFVQPPAPNRAAQKPATRKASPVKRAPAPRKTANNSTAKSQSKLDFSQPSFSQRKSQVNGATKKMQQVSDDDISDDEDAFEPAPSTATVRSTRSRR